MQVATALATAVPPPQVRLASGTLVPLVLRVKRLARVLRGHQWKAGDSPSSADLVKLYVRHEYRGWDAQLLEQARGGVGRG